MKLSIIIPVYRAQDTLSRCLDSILRQSFTDYEMILVDDESPDKCPILCDRYAASNKNIQVIHKKNGGLSDARNAGIERAQGEYITFIDSDDAIQEDTLIVLMEELEKNSDIDILEHLHTPMPATKYSGAAYFITYNFLKEKVLKTC